MKLFFLIGVPILIASLIEGVIFPLPLTLLFILSWGIHKVDRRAFFLAFLSGIIVDLSLVRLVGLTSLFFLSMILFCFLYGKKFTPSHFVFYVPYAFFSLGFYQLLFYSHIQFLSLILSFFIFFLIRFYVDHIYLRYVPPEQMRLEL